MSESDGSRASVSLAVPEWYVFKVRPRHEKVVALQLAQKEQPCFLPLVRESRCWAKRLTTVDLPLFPGYVFCRSHRFGFRPVLETRGVIDVLRVGQSPAPVAPDEVEAVRRAIEQRVPIEPCAYFDLGRKVHIRTGPLAGLCGPIVEVRNSNRLVLSITLLKRAVQVEVNLDDVAHDEQHQIYKNFDQCNANVS